MRKSFMLLLSAVFVMCPGLSFAEEEQKSGESVIKLDDVFISASRVEEKKKEIPYFVQTIPSERIEASSALDLGDLLAEIGIGHIQKYPGALASIGIRGFRTETHGNDLLGKVLILLNGRRAGTGNLAKITTKNIERIEIIRGPASVQYGSAAVGGIVNVITRQGKGRPTAFGEGILGSWDYREGSLGGQGEFKNLDFSGSYTYYSKGDYDTAEGIKYHNTGVDRVQNVSANLGYTFLE
jgi:vitamin B12 transporter